MEISEHKDYWELRINPTSPIVSEDDQWDTKGYKAFFGSNDGEFSVVKVYYSKRMFGLDDVVGFSKNVGNCKVCEAMTAEARALKNISLLTDNGEEDIPTHMAPDDVGAIAPKVLEASEDSARANIHPPVPMQTTTAPMGSDLMKDLFMNMWLNTTFTRPGMFFIGTLLDDEQMLERSVPTTPQDQAVFTAEMADFFAGKTDIVRTPRQMEQYSSYLKQAVGIVDEDEEGAGSYRTSKKKKRVKGKHGTKFI